MDRDPISLTPNGLSAARRVTDGHPPQRWLAAPAPRRTLTPTDYRQIGALEMGRQFPYEYRQVQEGWWGRTERAVVTIIARNQAEADRLAEGRARELPNGDVVRLRRVTGADNPNVSPK